MSLLHYFICVYCTVLSINAFILYQSLCNDGAAILCFGGSVFSEILAVAHYGK